MIVLSGGLQSCGKEDGMGPGGKGFGISAKGESVNASGKLFTCDTRESQSSCAVYGYAGATAPGCPIGYSSEGGNCPAESLVGSCLVKSAAGGIFYDVQTFFYGPHFKAENVKQACGAGFVPAP
jgi:hypothetical protein